MLWLSPAALDSRTIIEKKQTARQQFERAEKARAALAAKPQEERRPADYQAVIRLYGEVVRLAPTVRQAPESLFRAAQLYQQMAQEFAGDAKAPKYSAAARLEYEFLLKEYPQNRFSAPARKALAELPEAAATAAPPPRPPASAAAPAQTAARPAPPPHRAQIQGALGTPPESARPRGPVLVSNIREWATPNYTRVVIDLDDEVEYEAGRITNPERIFFDLHNTRAARGLARRDHPVEGSLLRKIRLAQNRTNITRVVLEVDQIGSYSAFLLPNPYRLVIDINGEKPAATAPQVAARKEPAPKVESPPWRPPLTAESKPRQPADGATESKTRSAAEAPNTVIPSTSSPTSKPVYEAVKPARPTREGHRSLTRTLGLKINRIVIDAGHGGHDTGTIGPSGFMEKELVLDISKRLGALLEERLGSQVIYTRESDVFVPLENRTGVANQKQADLFVSVHANSSRDPRARGVETYYLNFTTAQDALEVAARENAVSEKSIHELQDLVKKITLREKVDESREFAAEVQRALHTTMARGNAGLRNRGVKKAPFIVLIGANMPSILAEISFVSNPQDERLLKKPEYRQRVAEALCRGIQRYATSLGGLKVANGGTARLPED